MGERSTRRQGRVARGARRMTEVVRVLVNHWRPGARSRRGAAPRRWRRYGFTALVCYDLRMTDVAKKRATYQDVLTAPSHLVAELIHGTLITSPRPASPHAHAASVLGMDLGNPFQRGRGGAGGWWMLDEPELHLGEHVLVPELAAWRRERMPTISECGVLRARAGLGLRGPVAIDRGDGPNGKVGHLRRNWRAVDVARQSDHANARGQ